MRYIPGGREVERSLKQSLKDIKSSLKQVNAQVGKFLGKGDYKGAEELISTAKKIGQFEEELDTFRKRWKEIKHGSNPLNQTKEKPLPLWKYYAPTLRLLRDLGGTAKKETIEMEMEPGVSELFPPSEIHSKGKRPRWAFMMRRALGAMEKEGFVQRIKKEWRITPSGRKAAESNWNGKESKVD